ncbi:RagB/SusD family nutrient uptake outer membrane protein [Sphingobacterium sp. JB170]|uniref:RagB/SusD family nutrient uptake outer membrane protein n=1 Tax=Sphingobacterium sp. JB170 TaxID=1434842 RepID=UPI00097F64E7|nr:RagB/SusD family nutrient uptake outer membrane protein [Sphingobacterium sp. JB170]SJN50423.1 hypothetical protein FM107_20530 [Sphingobacterium sp. JB170]
MRTYLKLSISALLCSACSTAFLEEQPNSNIFSPKSVDDFQRLLDNTDIVGITSALPQLASDEYFIISYEHWQSARTAIERNSYVWDADVYGGEVNIKDWNDPYTSIYYSNNIINEIKKASKDGNVPLEFRDVYGQAIFQRAKVYYDLLKNYSPPFDSETQETDLGVPLRLDPSIDYMQERSTVKECYDQIFQDINEALANLRFWGPLPARERVTKLAAYSLLSRIHLYRREYIEAERFADSVLNRYDKLIDYNTVEVNVNTPFLTQNDELLMYGRTVIYNNSGQLNPYGDVFVDTSLIKMYDANDLRLQIYFIEKSKGLYTVARGYNGNGLVPFTGFAVDEVLLNKTECLVRRAHLSSAENMINRLLINRYKSGTFVPVFFNSEEEALARVLEERRKELVWRALRWDDIKRLNKEGANIQLSRVFDAKETVLNPNSPKYTFNIPQDEINRSGITQNIR